jgi:hypothetical protein
MAKMGLKPKELAQFRSKCIKTATENVTEFIKENHAVLAAAIEMVLSALQEKDRVLAKTTSYNLAACAASFDRPDITDVADFLYKILDSAKYDDRDDLLGVFYHAIKALKSQAKYSKEFQQDILTKLRQSL